MAEREELMQPAPSITCALEALMPGHSHIPLSTALCLQEGCMQALQPMLWNPSSISSSALASAAFGSSADFPPPPPAPPPPAAPPAPPAFLEPVDSGTADAADTPEEVGVLRSSIDPPAPASVPTPASASAPSPSSSPPGEAAAVCPSFPNEGGWL